MRIAVSDTGFGMDAATLERAAEAFFTTKPPGQGTGLGLPMVRSFSEQCGGAFTLTSAPGQGTTVTLWLPAGNDPATLPVDGLMATFPAPLPMSQFWPASISPRSASNCSSSALAIHDFSAGVFSRPDSGRTVSMSFLTGAAQNISKRACNWPSAKRFAC